MPAGGAIVLFGVLLFVLFAIVLPVWVYNDAQRNSSHSALLWALVAFFGGLLGVLLYLLIGRDRTGGSGGRGGRGVGSGPRVDDGWNDRNDGNDGWGDDSDEPEVRR